MQIPTQSKGTAGIVEAKLVTVTSRDGTPIALWKRGAGPSLLAVHGTAADHSAWDPVVPLLADRFTVYAMDRRGRGASGDAPEYALEREVEDVVAVVDALPGPVHLYGHSFGGVLAAEAALRARNLGRLVLYEGGPMPPGLRLFPDDFVVRLEALIQAGQREEALTAFMLTAAGVTSDELPVLRRSSAWPGRVAAVHTIPRELQALRAFNDYRIDFARFGAIETPVLLVTGELTEPRRREMWERLTHVFKHARIAFLPGQRHAAHQTAPDLLAAALRDFLLAQQARPSDLATRAEGTPMQTPTPSMGMARVNKAELYYERRGSGPPVLFISGATGDAGHFAQVAELLADEFTVVTYDRRGNSRSPRPAGWTSTSMDEQADDAVGLLRALELAPAAVFGTSGGAVILLNLLLRHPGVLRGAIVHEPPLTPVLPNAAELGTQLRAMTEEVLAKGGPRGAIEAFVRAKAGDASFERLDPPLRERMLANGEVFFTTELEAFVSYVPEAAALAGVKAPVQVMAGADNRGVYYHEAAKWVADRLGVGLEEMSGAHAPYLDRPQEMVDAIRPFLRRVS